MRAGIGVFGKPEQTFLHLAGCGGCAQVQRSQCFRDDASREQITNGIARYDLLRH